MCLRNRLRGDANKVFAAQQTGDVEFGYGKTSHSIDFPHVCRAGLRCLVPLHIVPLACGLSAELLPPVARSDSFDRFLCLYCMCTWTPCVCRACTKQTPIRPASKIRFLDKVASLEPGVPDGASVP